jgi:cellulose synthase/poly-beta-1,6-N-acetylglucosamine synthase-like glycosyltransferase
MLSGGMIVDFDSLIQVIKSEDFLLLLFMTSEPFTIQEILNEVVKNDFESSPFQFSGLLGLLVPFLPEIGFNVISFNDLFQPYLFSNVDYGMANNIWAQMWSAGGYFLFFIFIIIYNYILYIGSKYIRYTEGSLKIFIIFLMVIWSFYIHRNDIVGQLTLEKRAFIIYLVALVSSWIIFVVIQKIKNVLFMRKFQ